LAIGAEVYDRSKDKSINFKIEVDDSQQFIVVHFVGKDSF
jgi:hypothetical protein